MSTDDFEKRLERQPLRQIPGEWREEILSAARQASLAEHAPPVLRSSTAEGGQILRAGLWSSWLLSVFILSICG